MRRLAVVLCLMSAVLVRGAFAQPAFAVATIRPSTESVKFERDGKTEISRDRLLMRDVTLSTCIKWEYGVQQSQISGPEWIASDHFDIEAKPDEPESEAQMKLMMQTLLASRFKLRFHRQSKERKSFVLTVAKGGSKLQKAKVDGPAWRQNSSMGMVAKSMTMREFADFISGPVESPVVDKTGLEGKYDFAIDFSAYVPKDQERPDVAYVLNLAMSAELGLKLDAGKETVEVMVVDRVEKPTEN